MKKVTTNQNPKMDKSLSRVATSPLGITSSIINNTSDAIVVTSLKGEITLWNNGAIELYGYTSEEALGKNISIVYGKEDLPELGSTIEKVLQGDNITNAEVKVIDKFKNIHTVLLSVNGLKDEKGKINQLVGLSKDITEQKKAELDLIKAKEVVEISENYLENIINNIGAPVFVKDEESKFLLVNEAFCEFLDLTRENLIGKTLAEDIPPNEQEIFLKIDRQVLETGKENINEETLTVQGQETKIISTRKTRYIDNNGKKHLIGVIRDNTEQIKTESELKKAQEIARLGSWYLDVSTGEISWSDELYRMYGFDPTLPIPPYSEHEKYLTPESWELLTSSIENTRNTGIPYSIELKTNQKTEDGNWQWMFAQGEAVFDSENNIIALRGIAQDITDRKNAEEGKIQLTKIIDQSLNEIYVFDADTLLFEYVNSGALKNIGYSIEEMANMTPLHIKPDFTEAKFRDLLVPLKSTEKTKIVFETRHLRKDKSSYPVEIHLQRIEQQNKGIYLAVILDITERKIAEEKIMESEEKYRTLFEQSMIGIGMGRGNDVVFGNKAMMAIWKYDSLEEYKKKPLIEHIAPEYRELIQNRVKAGLSNKGKNLPPEYEYDIICRDGEIKNVRGHTSYIKIGDEIYSQTVVMDVTQRVKKEKELKESETNISAILNSLPSSVCVIDETGKILKVNESWKEFGRSNSNNKASVPHTEYNYFDVCRADLQNKDAKLILEGLLGLIQGKTEEFDFEYPCHTPEKKQWFLMRADLMKTKEKQIVISHIDITYRKISEENIKETLTQLNLAVDTAKLGIWSNDIRTGELVWNNELFEIFGTTPSEFEHTFEAFKKLVHPEDLDYVLEEQEKVFQKKSITGLHYRIIRPDNEVRYIYASATPIFDEEKNLIKIIGINLDITKDKKAEEKIAQANLELIDAVSSLNELKKQLEDQNVYLKKELDMVFNFEEMVYGSAAFSQVLTDLERVAPTDATVLILGESGTGKELLARALHNLSLRKNKPFIKVNCSAIPSELIESEFFGYKKGSFTGAVSDKIGKFELADGGTLFLDEIGDLSLAMQPKLLRFLQEGEMEVVGGTTTRSLDVRIVAATNKDLKKEVKKDQFREDLYFRLNVFPIEVPALRERKEDIPLLVEHFSNKFGKKYRKNVKYISDSAMQNLMQHSWPGNIRELENLIERSVILSDSEFLSLQGFDSKNRKKGRPISSSDKLTLNEVQRNHILSVLEKTNWKIDGPDGAALILDIKPSTFRDKMKKLGIKRSNPQPR